MPIIKLAAMELTVSYTLVILLIAKWFIGTKVELDIDTVL